MSIHLVEIEILLQSKALRAVWTSVNVFAQMRLQMLHAVAFLGVCL